MTLRDSVIAEAQTWIGTPFHHEARIKGAGVDCLMLLAEVYERAGVVGHISPPHYTPDWHMHRDAEKYVEGLLDYAHEVSGPERAGILLVRFGRTFSHAAIIVNWPRVIHAYWQLGVVWADADKKPLAGQPMKFYSPFSDA